jgi:hypothetical protein
MKARKKESKRNRKEKKGNQRGKVLREKQHMNYTHSFSLCAVQYKPTNQLTCNQKRATIAPLQPEESNYSSPATNSQSSYTPSVNSSPNNPHNCTLKAAD